jgi:hypothetical protein
MAAWTGAGKRRQSRLQRTALPAEALAAVGQAPHPDVRPAQLAAAGGDGEGQREVGGAVRHQLEVAIRRHEADLPAENSQRADHARQ